MNHRAAGRTAILLAAVVVWTLAAVWAAPSVAAGSEVTAGPGVEAELVDREGVAAVHAGVASGPETGPVVAQADGGGTSIEAEANRSTAAFDRPALIRGELRTSAGYPIAGNQVTIHVGERTYEPTTNSDGAFTVLYRPVSVDAGTSEVDVTYEAAEGMVYTNASTTIPLSIRQVTPNLTVSANPDRVQFGENLTVTTTASVDGTVVPDLPLSVEAAGTEISTLRTGDTGFAAGEWTLPVDVPAGDAEVAVSVAQSADAAVGPANATAPLTVEQTPTTLSMDANWSGETVVIDGRLAPETDGVGRPLPANLSIEMTVADGDETIQTDANGTFSLSIREALLEQPDNALQVTASFDDEGTNLGSSRIERTYDVAELQGKNPELGEFAVMAYAGAAFLVLVVVAIIGRRRRSGDSSLPDTRQSTVDGAGQPAGAPAPRQADAAPARPGESGTGAMDETAGSEPVGERPPLADDAPTEGGDDDSGAHRPGTREGPSDGEPDVGVAPGGRAAGPDGAVDPDDEHRDRESVTRSGEGLVDTPEQPSDTPTGAAGDRRDATDAARTDRATDAGPRETDEGPEPGGTDPGQSAVSDGDLAGLLGQAAEHSAEQSSEQWLADARTALAEGDDVQAVAGAYAAAHRHVTVFLGLERVLTPRKLLAAAEGRLGPDALAALETLTEAYEHVVFTSEAAGAVEEVAVDAAQTVLAVDGSRTNPVDE